MRASVSSLAVVGLATNVRAQQLALYQYPYDILGLSANCVEALDTTVDCSDLLGRHAGRMFVSPAHTPTQTSPVFLEEEIRINQHLTYSDLIFDPLDEESLQSVCTDECKSSLESLRTTVLGACDAEEDLMVWDGQSYPGMHSSLLLHQ